MITRATRMFLLLCSAVGESVLSGGKRDAVHHLGAGLCGHEQRPPLGAQICGNSSSERIAEELYRG